MPYTYPFKYVDQDLKLKVWGKAHPIIGQDPFLWRSDNCDAIMRFTDHGETDSKYGWEIDHIKPTSLGGADDLSNLQPLHWKNNRKKGDSYPWYGQ
ncbi:MAG: HNH endonuclease signature motif containing protein [Ignavibacteria bacterium]|nr:HNH endonuclease signature motif containing protein [Ignavibacteria bacterium]